MSLQKQMEQAAISNMKSEQERHKRFQESSLKRLKTIVEKKLRTTFIGDISRFEEYIGKSLWGHGQDEDDCTPEQLKWRQVWEKCRADILTNGNNQLRAIQSELVQYTIEWNCYQNNIVVKQEGE